MRLRQTIRKLAADLWAVQDEHGGPADLPARAVKLSAAMELLTAKGDDLVLLSCSRYHVAELE